MPPACPGESHVHRYIQGHFSLTLSPLPGGEAAGEWGLGVVYGAVFCSNNRNHPPDKPGAFVNSLVSDVSSGPGAAGLSSERSTVKEWEESLAKPIAGWYPGIKR